MTNDWDKIVKDETLNMRETTQAGINASKIHGIHINYVGANLPKKKTTQL
jgi:hypothetical protein